MGFLTSLFGGENNYLTFILALGIVIVMIVLAVWLIKVVGQATRTVGRGRNRRLAVVESIAIDQKRQAIIIRRDGAEHLIVIGGPNDLVVESGFEASALTTAARTQKKPLGTQDKAATETANPSSEVSSVSRLRALDGHGTSKSLRHTGLLRTGEDEDSALAGGKPENVAETGLDSATTRIRPDEDDRLDTTRDLRESDFAEGAKTRQ